MATDDEMPEWAVPILDAQIQARHDERPDEALRLGALLLERLPADKAKMRAFAHNEMGFVLMWLVGDPRRAEDHFRQAIALRPRAELPSLGLYHALAEMGQWERAFEEIVRFVALRDSAEYRELLNDAVRNESTGRRRELIDEARRLLARWN